MADVMLLRVAEHIFAEAQPDPYAWKILEGYGLDLNAVTGLNGPIIRRKVKMENCLFDLDDGDGSEWAWLMCAHDQDGESLLDLVAWSYDDPGRFGVYAGVAPVLGLDQITNPASWSFGNILHVHRTPLNWLRANCHGVCILDHAMAPIVLGDALGPLMAEDADHARDLKDVLCRSYVDPRSILVPASKLREVA